MTVNVRHDESKTPITPQIDLLIGNALRKRNSLKTYLASAISAIVLKIRQDQRVKQPADKMDELVLYPGVKDFDPAMAKTQLFEAAEEFGKDYQDGYRIPDNLAQVVLDTVLQPMIFVLNTDDEPKEYRQIKSDGDARVAVLFPAAGEASNAEQPSGLVRALFDDQVHDSRAWFMYATLGTREMWGGYFRYRMIQASLRRNYPWAGLLFLPSSHWRNASINHCRVPDDRPVLPPATVPNTALLTGSERHRPVPLLPRNKDR